MWRCEKYYFLQFVLNFLSTLMWVLDLFVSISLNDSFKIHLMGLWKFCSRLSRPEKFKPGRIVIKEWEISKSGRSSIVWITLNLEAQLIGSQDTRPRKEKLRKLHKFAGGLKQRSSEVKKVINLCYAVKRVVNFQNDEINCKTQLRHFNCLFQSEWTISGRQHTFQI